MKIRINGILYDIASVQVSSTPTGMVHVLYISPLKGLATMNLTLKHFKALLVLEDE